jgi:hypothetical protein
MRQGEVEEEGGQKQGRKLGGRLNPSKKKIQSHIVINFGQILRIAFQAHQQTAEGDENFPETNRRERERKNE